MAGDVGKRSREFLMEYGWVFQSYHPRGIRQGGGEASIKSHYQLFERLCEVHKEHYRNIALFQSRNPDRSEKRLLFSVCSLSRSKCYAKS